ncbi:hypothetical protein HY493_05070 [Candidatus Woesearchaeota archaeon]|nr:hypothetical protein [Candidatus Woesearchaeota archaeon]
MRVIHFLMFFILMAGIPAAFASQITGDASLTPCKELGASERLCDGNTVKIYSCVGDPEAPPSSGGYWDLKSGENCDDKLCPGNARATCVDPSNNGGAAHCVCPDEDAIPSKDAPFEDILDGDIVVTFPKKFAEDETPYYDEMLKEIIESFWFRFFYPDWFGYFMGVAYRAKQAGRSGSESERAFASITPLADDFVVTDEGVFVAKAQHILIGLNDKAVGRAKYGAKTQYGTRTLEVTVTESKVYSQDNGVTELIATAKELGLDAIQAAKQTGDSITFYGVEGDKFVEVRAAALVEVARASASTQTGGVRLTLAPVEKKATTQERIINIRKEQSTSSDGSGTVIVTIMKSVFEVTKDGSVNKLENVPQKVVATDDEVARNMQEIVRRGEAIAEQVGQITLVATRVGTTDSAYALLNAQVAARLTIAFAARALSAEEARGLTPAISVHYLPGVWKKEFRIPPGQFAYLLADRIAQAAQDAVTRTKATEEEAKEVNERVTALASTAPSGTSYTCEWTCRNSGTKVFAGTACSKSGDIDAQCDTATNKASADANAAGGGNCFYSGAVALGVC